MPDNSDNKPKEIELLSGVMLGLHRREQSISSQLATTETKIDNFFFTVVLGKHQGLVLPENSLLSSVYEHV